MRLSRATLFVGLAVTGAAMAIALFAGCGDHHPGDFAATFRVSGAPRNARTALALMVDASTVQADQLSLAVFRDSTLTGEYLYPEAPTLTDDVVDVLFLFPADAGGSMVLVVVSGVLDGTVIATGESSGTLVSRELFEDTVLLAP